MNTKELLKFASTKSGGVSVEVDQVILTTTTGTHEMDKSCVDSLAIRD